MHNIRKHFLWLWFLAMVGFHLYSMGFGLLPTEVHRSIHLGFALVAMALVLPKKERAVDWLFAFIAGGSAFYIAFFHIDIAHRAASPLEYEFILAAILLISLIYMGWRVLGPVLPCLAIFFLLYVYFGRYAPGEFIHRGYSITRMVQHMYLTTEGVFGIALGVSSTFVFLFVLFGALLNSTGGSRLFNDLALALAGRASSGPALVAVTASAMMGTISGSSIGNVATTGTITIPMMIRNNYSRTFSGAVEACASTGGQLMPPIMGASAFIMAQFLNISYMEVTTAALIPAMAFYAALIINVHFYAKKKNMHGVTTSLSVKEVFIQQGILLIPIIVIVYFLLEHYTPLTAGFWGIVSLLGIVIVRNPKNIVSTMKQIEQGCIEGAKAALPIALACSLVGLIIGSATLTSFASVIATNILSWSGGALFPTLVLTMITCLLLGMGLPSTANYIITSTLLAPTLMGMGVLPIAAHMFVFFFGIMADLTPPVCLAAMTAGGIAQTSGFRVGLRASLLGIIAYMIPYSFVYTPALLLQGDKSSLPYYLLGIVMGSIAFAASVQGWGGRVLSAPVRGLLFCAAVACFTPWISTILVGSAVIMITFLLVFLRKS